MKNYIFVVRRLSLMGNAVYQGFWIRLLAYTIDSLLLTPVLLLLNRLLYYTSLPLFSIFGIAILLYVLLDAVYEIVLTATVGGTVGKLLLGMQVTDATGQRIGFARSTGRCFAKYLSALLLCIGYLMVAWDEKKQGLHDKLAKTYVVAIPKTRIPPVLRTAITFAAAGFLACYLLYLLWFLCFVSIDSFRASFHPIVAGDFREEVDDRCAGRWFIARDACYKAYLENDEQELLGSADRLLLCAEMKTGSGRAECLRDAAIKQQNESICDTIGGWRSQECRKFYAFSADIRRSLLADITPSGNLTVGQFKVEKAVYDECLPLDNFTFTNDETICVTIVNVTAFEVGTNGLHWFRLDIFLWDSEGRLVDLSRDLFAEEHNVFLYNDTVLEERYFYRPQTLAPGAYTLQTDLLDRISKRAWSGNITFTVLLPPPPVPEKELKMLKLVVGTPEDVSCEPAGPSFPQGETVCFLPMRVAGFETGADGVHWFDADVKIWSEGRVVSYHKRIFGEDGHVLLKDGILNEPGIDAVYQWINLNTSSFGPGAYTYELQLYDLVGEGRARKNATFEIVDAVKP